MPTHDSISTRRAGRRRMPPRLAALLLSLLAAGSSLAATFSIEFTNQGLPLEDPRQGKFYIYEERKRELYLAWGYTGRTARVPSGSYDILIKYENDQVKQERVLEKYTVVGDVVYEIDFDIPLAELTLAITSAGSPIPTFSGGYNLHRAGQRGTPLAQKRPGGRLVVRPGLYDIEVVYRGPDGLRSRWLEGYPIRGVHQEVVELGSNLAELTLTLVRQGVPIPTEEGFWGIYRPGERESAVTEAGSGESRAVSPGIYDVGLFFGTADEPGERWLPEVEIEGNMERRVEIAEIGTPVRVRIAHDGVELRDAWFVVHAPGNRESALYSGRSGERLEISPGLYDIGCFLRRGGIRAGHWFEGHRLGEQEEALLELNFDAASLRVRPPRRRRRSRKQQQNLLLVVDSSAEMNSRVGSRTRLELLREAATASVDVFIGTRTNVGLRAFGITPRSQDDCSDSSRLVPVSRIDRTGLGRGLDLLRPSGFSPIGYSLEQAAEDLPAEGSNSLLLIAGSVDDCGGDPCAAAAKLLRDERVERIDVIALGVDDRQQQQLDCIGAYHPVNSEVELRSTLLDVLRQIRRGEEGTVTVFTPGWSSLVVQGELGERLEVAAGSYDVLVRSGNETFRWPGVAVRGNVSATAGPRPPR